MNAGRFDVLRRARRRLAPVSRCAGCPGRAPRAGARNRLRAVFDRGRRRIYSRGEESGGRRRLRGQPETLYALASALSAAAGGGRSAPARPARRCRPAQRRRFRADRIRLRAISAPQARFPLCGGVGLYRACPLRSLGGCGFVEPDRIPVHPGNHPGADRNRQVPDRGQEALVGRSGGVERLGRADPLHRRGRSGFCRVGAALAARGAAAAEGEGRRRLPGGRVPAGGSVDMAQLSVLRHIHGQQRTSTV